jgi:hypothetical protein
MLTTTSAQRFLRATAATLSWQGLDYEGNEANPGTVTVQVLRSDGTELLAAGTATSGTLTAPRTVTLTASQTANLDRLTAKWSSGGVLLAETHHEIVGGVYITAAQLRNAERSLSSVDTYPTSLLNEGRAEVERMFEDICGVAFVPRFEVERLDGHGYGQLALSWPQLRNVRWCRIWDDDVSYTTFTAAEIAAIKPNRMGLAFRTDGGWFDSGTQNVEIAFEHGYDRPPADLYKASIRAIRHQVNKLKSALDDRATSFTMMEGGTVTLATPGVGQWHTGIPEVDETLKRYSHRTPGMA